MIKILFIRLFHILIGEYILIYLRFTAPIKLSILYELIRTTSQIKNEKLATRPKHPIIDIYGTIV